MMRCASFFLFSFFFKMVSMMKRPYPRPTPQRPTRLATRAISIPMWRCMRTVPRAWHGRHVSFHAGHVRTPWSLSHASHLKHHKTLKTSRAQQQACAHHAKLRAQPCTCKCPAASTHLYLLALRCHEARRALLRCCCAVSPLTRSLRQLRLQRLAFDDSPPLLLLRI